jgi:hypothetical protein
MTQEEYLAIARILKTSRPSVTVLQGTPHFQWQVDCRALAESLRRMSPDLDAKAFYAAADYDKNEWNPPARAA